MLRAKTVKAWYRVHKWTSLICTAFLLILCITGLPLVFREEIAALRINEVRAPNVPAGTPMARLDRLVNAALQEHPDQRPYTLIWDDEKENVINVTTGSFRNGEWDDFHSIPVDARTAQVLGTDEVPTDPLSRAIVSVMSFAITLHTTLFAGEPGRLFLGVMGLLFGAAIVTGAVVYGPFMRKLNFGAVRANKASRVYWLDIHNLFGIVATMWMLVVGLTGMVTTFGDLLIKLWEVKTLSAMMAPYAGKPPLDHFASVDTALAAARQAVPDMDPYFISFPSGVYTTSRHFNILFRGRTPFTSKLVRPALIDAETGQLASIAEPPWHIKAVLLSYPLHFGDYGGLPLKIIWAVLDAATILILISGLYLWLGRRKTPTEARLEELERIESAGMPVSVGSHQ
jgi:uncharacterized iron-regulated membrane protein